MAGTDSETAPLKGALEEENHDPEKDPELTQNGGRFSSKRAILQVTWRFPVDTDPLNILALIYGYLPFIVPTVFFVYLVITRRFMAFYGLVVSGIISALNEGVFKPILKDPRPSGSANRKFNEQTKKWEMKEGMPSGHVLNATTMLVWCILEIALRGPGFDDQPLITWNFIILIVVTTAPVPWARIHNKDHSLAQCIAGGSLGIAAGIAAYYVRYTFFPFDTGKEWCIQSLCLVSGKPWDDFVPATVAKVGTAAAALATTAPSRSKEKHAAEAAVEKSHGKNRKLRGLAK